MTTFDPRITAYFGEDVLQAGFLPVPHLLLRHYRRLDLTPAHVIFVLHLMQSVWDLQQPPHTVGDLARRMAIAPRTVRRYCEDLAARGLLRLQARFDRWGRQIENGYDLAPLFARLTTFDGRFPPASLDALSAPGSDRSTPPDRSVHPGRIADAPPPPDRSVHPGRIGDVPVPDRAIHAARTARSGLNGRKQTKNREERKERTLLPAVAANPQDGYSLRWEHALSPEEVERSRRVLEAAGVGPPVRDRVAPSLHPAEAWALRAYATALGWRPALLIAQVYDKTTRGARRAAELTATHDAVGRELDALENATAEVVLRLVAEHCPDDRAAVFDAPLVRCGTSHLHAAATAVWSMIAALRGAPALPTRGPGHTTPPGPEAALWEQVCASLQRSLPPKEFDTWFASTGLILEDDLAVIVVPHIFARERISAAYLPALRAALAAVVGRPLEVSLLIEPEYH